MDSDSLMQLIIILVLLMFSAFFSASETALTMVNKVRLKTLADEGNKKAARVLKILNDYGKMLTAILIGNNVVNLVASSLATLFAQRINVNVGIATAVLTIVLLLFAEIIPKNASAAQSEALALSFGGLINILMNLLTPVIFIVDALAKGILKLFRIDMDAKETMTESELKTYVEVSHEDGVIEEEEKEMIYNVFEFGDSVAKDIMIPKSDMVSVSVDSDYESIIVKYKEHMYTRYPVYEGSNDNIVGLINVKDLLLVEDKENFDVRKVMRTPYFTLEFKKTAELLADMRSKAESIALVLNEYGDCEGLVTIEDLLEEIVGEIRDEYDDYEETLIMKMEENSYLIEGSMKLDDINDELGTELESEDYDSIAGLIIDYLEDRLPEDGETITTREGIVLKVQGVTQNRVQKVIMTLPNADNETEE